MQSGKSLPTFRRNISTPSSRSQSKPSKKQTWSGQATNRDYFLLGLLFNPEDGGDICLQNVGWLSPDYTALRISRKTEIFKPPLWEPQIQYWYGSGSALQFLLVISHQTSECTYGNSDELYLKSSQCKSSVLPTSSIWMWTRPLNKTRNSNNGVWRPLLPVVWSRRGQQAL
jgi:hypothetical protein